MDFSDKMQRCHDYIEALEEERRKIQVFQRELPLCLELVSQAIESCRQQMSGTTQEYFHGQSECSEQTSSDGPVLEEFIPIKKTSDDEDEQQSHQPNDNKDKNNDKSGKKSDWLRSVQLWNQTPDPPVKEDTPKKIPSMEVKKNGGAFHPFKRGKAVGTNPTSAPSAATSSTAETATGCSSGSRKEEKEGQSQRKARRCWSPELHRRFLHALQQLGGSHVATPKQIRELMKVDGLTNDEVKSHLQKYRLHTRRPNPAIQHNGNPQAPQFVVVGGIWVPPPEYTAVAATTSSGEATGVTTANGIYAPVASVPPSHPQGSTQRQQPMKPKKSQSEERGSHSEGGVQSNSPATSSSTHTTTTSPVF